MPSQGAKGHRRVARGGLIAAAALAGMTAAGVGLGLLALLITTVSGAGACDAGSGSAGASVVIGPPGAGQTVGASEFGGPGDPSTGTHGYRSDSLLTHPDSYAELGGLNAGTATAMGGLSYMTPLRITAGHRSVIAYKRDIGLGGGPVAGLPRVIDLWWQLTGPLGIPYSDGQWSGAVRIERPPDTGAGALLGVGLSPTDSVAATDSAAAARGAAQACSPQPLDAVTLTTGPRARLLPSGLAAAPQNAPPQVKAMIAAGNQIAGRPYVYGAAHGVPLSALSGAYDCSSSVEHLLYGAGLVAVGFTVASGELESFGAAGPGRWVTLYASADHVFMYVAGLRWDTHDAAGAGDGSGGIGWHPLVRDAGGFVARHPVGL